MLNDNDLLWNTPLDRAPRLAVPKPLVPGGLALTHSTYRHAGVAKSTMSASRRNHWPPLARNVRG